jgi:hypothetical protein
MSVDQRLRAGLHRSAAAIEPRTAAALTAVEARTRRGRRTARVARLAVATALAAAVAIASPAALDRLRGSGPHVSPAAPSPLVGTYVVDVPDSEPARRQGMAGRWVVTLHADGVVQLTQPDVFQGNPYGASYQTDGDVLRTDVFVSSPGCQLAPDSVGIYRWARAGGVLEFTVVSDGCEARRLLFDLTWEVS